MHTALTTTWRRYPARITAILRWSAAVLAIAALTTALPGQVPPASFSTVLATPTSAVSIDFVAHPVRSGNFAVLVQQPDGNFSEYTMPASRIYLGTVRDQPGAIAAGLLKENGNLFTKVAFENGVEWSSAVGVTAITGNAGWSPAWPTTVLSAGGAGSIVYEAEVGIDLTYKYFLTTSGSVREAVEMAEYSIMAGNLAFLRDANLLHTVGKVVVRANQSWCPYDLMTTDNQRLPEVRNQWSAILPVGTTHDLALVTTPGGGAGLAYLGVIGTGLRYSANDADTDGDFSRVWRHEAGHNWGADHYEGGGNPEGDTIMSNNNLHRFSSSELVPIIAHRNSRLNILGNAGGYPVSLPPRANQDRASITPDSTAAVTIDVLANDSDANGDSLTIQSHDPTTAMGRSVTRSVGTGPSGRDQLTYSSTTALVSGTDWFSYRIVDATGRTATGYVMLRPTFEEDLLAHWSMDDESGGKVTDATSAARHGTTQGGTVWSTGIQGGAISLNGVDGHVMCKALDITGNTITITGWIRRNGSQAVSAGIAFSRLSGLGAGINLGAANELRYHWEAGNNPSWTFNSGLVPPDGVWTFVALVTTPSSATLYMKPVGGALQSVTVNGELAPLDFTSNFYLGLDPSNAGRRFKGDLDDFHIFGRSLTAVEIAALANRHGTASRPNPALASSRFFGRPVDLSWTGAAASTSFRVFLGRSYAAVRDANSASPEFRGTSEVPSLETGYLGVGNWFWRVDSSDGTTWFTGPVWHFVVNPNRNTLAVNFSNGDFPVTAVGDGQHTDALNAVAGIADPVSWHNQAVVGTGSLANGRGNGSYSGVSVSTYAANSYQAGGDGIIGNDASQRVFRLYLDDGEGGNGYFNGDGIGASIHIRNLGQYLLANDAESYTLSLFFNRDVGDTIFRPATVRLGLPAAPSGTAIVGLPFLGTINATILGNGQQPLPSAGGYDYGTRGWGRMTGLSADSLTISLTSSGAGRGTLSGFAITPVGRNRTPYEMWQLTSFGDDAGNEAVAGDDADPNEDGVPNLLAYAMGIDPLNPPVPGASAAQLGRLELLRTGSEIRLFYQRNSLATDVQLSLEQTSELNHPTLWISAVVSETLIGEENHLRTFNVLVAPQVGESRRFLRFRAQ